MERADNRLIFKDPNGDRVATATVQREFRLTVQLTPYMSRVLGPEGAAAVIWTINRSGVSGTLEEELNELHAIPGEHRVIPDGNRFHIWDPEGHEMGIITMTEELVVRSREYLTPYTVAFRARGNGHEGRPLIGEELGGGGGLGGMVERNYRDFLRRVRDRAQATPGPPRQLARR
ncbi:MAG TPA: hypothetical protein VJH24_00320 [Candidatus Bilamarchaeaceae archaeon]|nr:hypothetical protein [Candidatus Bilamarchaeaceae archaeon]